MELTADLILTGGRVATLDPARPHATALAIRNGRIMAVGGDEVAGLAGPDTRMVDLGGPGGDAGADRQPYPRAVGRVPRSL